MIDPTIQERFLALPDYYRQFIASDFASDAATILGEVEDLDEQQTKVFENCIVMYLLFFIEADEIVSLLFSAGVDSVKGERLVWALKESLPEFARQPDPEPTEAEDLLQEISEAEKALSSLPTMRTMASDMRALGEDSPSHSSSQADILQPPTIDTPRWDTGS